MLYIYIASLSSSKKTLQSWFSTWCLIPLQYIAKKRLFRVYLLIPKILSWHWLMMSHNIFLHVTKYEKVIGEPRHTQRYALKIQWSMIKCFLVLKHATGQMASPAAPEDDIDFWIIGWGWAACRHVSHQLEKRVSIYGVNLMAWGKSPNIFPGEIKVNVLVN